MTRAYMTRAYMTRAYMTRARYYAVAAILGLFAAAPFTPSLLAQAPQFRPVTDAMLANPDPGDWLMINRTFDQHRSARSIRSTRATSRKLRMAWTRGLPVLASCATMKQNSRTPCGQLGRCVTLPSATSMPASGLATVVDLGLPAHLPGLGIERDQHAIRRGR